jgi:hypothetical protein
MTTEPIAPDEPGQDPDVRPSGDPTPTPENPFDPTVDPDGGEPEPGLPGS